MAYYVGAVKTFQQMFCIEHTIWNRYFELDKVKRFNNMRYGDVILLHFDMIYAIFKTKTSKQKIHKMIIFDVINICLRMRQKIKQVYPHNEVYVVIHAEKRAMDRLVINSEAMRSVIDIIPDFAFVTYTGSIIDDANTGLGFYRGNNYKHIIYGKCSGLKQMYIPNNYQSWSILNGKLCISYNPTATTIAD